MCFTKQMIKEKKNKTNFRIKLEINCTKIKSEIFQIPDDHLFCFRKGCNTWQ